MSNPTGWEYEKLKSFFQTLGISHHVSCPHAHQQNGLAERKHRHIVEVGLALLAGASMPLKFWDEAFLTAVHIINMLPSRVINNDTPTERLLHVKPDYTSLRVFGCACWPNLRPYNSRKLMFRSKQCVFLGYSSQPKGVKCPDISTGRVYISRDVVFNETKFPFSELHPNAGAPLREEILLLPPNLTGLDHGEYNSDDTTVTLLPCCMSCVMTQEATLKKTESKIMKKIAQQGHISCARIGGANLPWDQFPQTWRKNLPRDRLRQRCRRARVRMAAPPDSAPAGHPPTPRAPRQPGEDMW